MRICFLFLVQFVFVVLIASAVEPSFYKKGTITIDLAHPVQRADLSMAFGGGVDGHTAGEEKAMLSPQNIQAMESSGLKPLSYRLRTELGVEAWHWNQHGRWSDEKHSQGYWISSSTSPTPILTSYGYRLPRRGDTLDEANNDGYSRLDDGNINTFWKSNPYLSLHYTGEPDFEHPQWVVLDFEKPEKINAIRLHWKEPYATDFRVQYASGGSVYLGHNEAWHDFPHGKIKNGRGGETFLFLGQPTFLGHPQPVRFIRILMTASSGTAPEAAHDPRDGMGYALGEVEAGELNAAGIFQDHVVHRPDTKQTLIYVSSTDPWHRACDRDCNTEQPGLDLIRTCGVTHQLSTLWAIPILYDTPENATAAASYIAKHAAQEKSPPRFELGEEPDGQRVDPKDVAALYAQISKKIHAALPAACLGGLSFVTVDVEPSDTTYRYDHRPWLRRFFQQLRKDHEENNFRFLTFEWYPFDDLLLPPAPLLLKQAERLHKSVARLRHGGIPASMPLMISEYGYSVFSGEPEVTLAAALLNAEIAAQFFLLEGTTSYLYGYEPNQLECSFGNSWGNLMMLLQNEKDSESTPSRLPTYYAAQLITQRWAPAHNGPCELYPVTSTLFLKKENPFISSYFLHQQKGGSALLIINKSPDHSFELTCHFAHQKKGATSLWKGPLEMYSYSSAQYQWLAAGPNGHPLYSKEPRHSFLKTAETPICVPAWSITVLREKN